MLIKYTRTHVIIVNDYKVKRNAHRCDKRETQ